VLVLDEHFDYVFLVTLDEVRVDVASAVLRLSSEERWRHQVGQCLPGQHPELFVKADLLLC
jgi:hypothetical protein